MFSSMFTSFIPGIYSIFSIIHPSMTDARALGAISFARTEIPGVFSPSSSKGIVEQSDRQKASFLCERSHHHL